METTNAIDPARFYTQNEIKEALKISTKRITQAMQENQLKGRILGRKRIVVGKHLIEWLSGDSQSSQRQQ